MIYLNKTIVRKEHVYAARLGCAVNSNVGSSKRVQEAPLINVEHSIATVYSDPGERISFD